MRNISTKFSNAHLSDETKEKVRSMLREISELESIGDACYNIARTTNRLINSKEEIHPRAV